MAETGGRTPSSSGFGESFLDQRGQPGDDWREVSGVSADGARPDVAAEGQSPYFEDATTDSSDEYPHVNDGQGNQDFYDHYRGGYPQ